ncbi:pyridoxine/pyridoxamine 5'-phosphate oxidase [Legionella rowbothamii]|uniref:pyridoxine/pyridoxamine 5'-phosphate oxidase n=1 Tax=Legionella rowbothamii TaxID=96229 RepID=UPI001055C76A|nr:pyridoxamine 5'-phosphate oxidase family protein [Legionella rowbothamii]
MPFNQLIDWLSKEKELGVMQPECAVLATCTSSGIPHSRVVAIREIKKEGILFFTQKGTRKVSELCTNPAATLNFLFAMQQRQVSIEGIAKPISPEENEHYWMTLPRERQLRFSAYAPTSGQVISCLHQLDKRKRELDSQFANQSIPMCDDYMGFRFQPETFVFYTVETISFSQVLRYRREGDGWINELLSP